MSKLLYLAAASTLVLPGSAFASPHPSAVDEVIVSAAPFAVSLDSLTTHVEVLTRADLDRAPAGGLGDVLANIPGVRSSAYGPGASRPIIRGLSGPRVLVLENGVGLIDASALSPDHAVAADPGAATRIEVLRGPSALAYGGSGVGGVVNVLDDRVPSTLPEGGIDGRISGSLSSVDRGRAVSGGLTGAAGALVFTIDGASRRSEDDITPVAPVSDRLAAAQGETADPSRRQRNTALSLDTYGAGVSYVKGDAFVGVSAKRTESVYGIPYAQLLPSGPPDPAAEGPTVIDLRQTRVDLRGESPITFLGPWFTRARVSAGWADYQHVEQDAATRTPDTRFLSDGWEGRFELVQAEDGGHQGAVGFQVLRRNFEAIGEEAFVPPVTITEQGVFTLQRWQAGRYGLDAGLRLDRRDLDSTVGQRAFTNISASGGLSFRPSEPVFLAVSLSHNQRAPTEFELFADGPHPGTGGYEIGDNTLGSEKVTSLELTARYHGGRWRLEGHLFAARYDGFIDAVATGAVEDGLPVFQFTQSNADFHGAEFESAIDIWRDGVRSLAAELDGDFVHGDTDYGAPARMPPWSLTGRLVWTSAQTTVTGELRHVGRQDRLAAQELSTDSYTLVNLRAEVRPMAIKDLRVFVEGRNLGDVEAREHVSFLKDIVVQPGRSIRVGAGYTF